jgi:hypothetical protein
VASLPVVSEPREDVCIPRLRISGLGSFVRQVPASGEQLGIAGARTPRAPSLAETKPQTRPFGNTRSFSHPQPLLVTLKP